MPINQSLFVARLSTLRQLVFGALEAAGALREQFWSHRADKSVAFCSAPEQASEAAFLSPEAAGALQEHIGSHRADKSVAFCSAPEHALVAAFLGSGSGRSPSGAVLESSCR